MTAQPNTTSLHEQVPGQGLGRSEVVIGVNVDGDPAHREEVLPHVPSQTVGESAVGHSVALDSQAPAGTLLPGYMEAMSRPDTYSRAPRHAAKSRGFLGRAALGRMWRRVVGQREIDQETAGTILPAEPEQPEPVRPLTPVADLETYRDARRAESSAARSSGRQAEGDDLKGADARVIGIHSLTTVDQPVADHPENQVYNAFTPKPMDPALAAVQEKYWPPADSFPAGKDHTRHAS